MAQKLLTLDEAAARLGISSDELRRLIDERKIFAIKDGASFKFKEEEVERYQSEAGSASGAYYLPVDESQDDDIGLVTDELLGAPPSSGGMGSGAIIGPSGVAGSDSDLKLGESDVRLVPDANDPASGGSGLKLVPGGSSSKLGGGSGKLGTGSSGKLNPNPGSAAGDSSKLKSGGSSKVSSGPGTKDGGSDLTISESGLALGEDDDIEIGSSVKGAPGKSGPGSSKTKLSDAKFEDDDIVLGGSSGGSGIGDSGINLAAATDSGLSLEEPLELGGDDGVSDDSGETDMSSDDDFLLTPMLELDEQESDSSGSQVIALDSEGFDDSAATQLGSQPGGLVGAGAGMMGAPGQAMAEAPMMYGMPSVPQSQHSAFTISFLVLCFISLGLTGMMMFEMIRNIWSWDGTSAASTTIMDGIINLFP